MVAPYMLRLYMHVILLLIAGVGILAAAAFVVNPISHQTSLTTKCFHRHPLPHGHRQHVRVCSTTPSNSNKDTELKSGKNGRRRRSKLRIDLPFARRPSFETGLRYSSDDWKVNVLSIPRSFLLRRIKSHLLFDQLVCAVVLVARKVLDQKYHVHLSVPLLGHTLLGSFLGLLLVFRTNSAYARFWDARGEWAKIKATCCALAMESVAYIRSHSPNSATRFEKLLAAFPDAFAYTCLSGMTQLSPQVDEALKQAESFGDGAAAVPSSALPPATKLIYHMHRALADAAVESPTAGKDFIESTHLTSMTHEVNSLGHALANCEKIVKTPVPLSYSRHTSRFLTLWTGFLPFAIVEPLGLLSIPLMGIMSWLLYGIEEIGHLIEQPFVPVLGSMGTTSKGAEKTQQEILFERSSKTQPYDIGMPVCTLAGQIRAEVKQITGS